MPFDDVLGQASAVAILTRALRANTVHHAYRFEGPPGVGKERTALRFARALVCTQGLSALGCGECSACRRALGISPGPPAVPQHPDVVFVARGLYTPHVISAKETSTISVEQVRRVVLGRSQLPPHEADRLIFLIKDADELGVSAANALLKTLEEPHTGVHFVLLTSRPQCLLDTLRSRTQAVRFGTLASDVIATLMQDRGLDPDLAPLAEGSMAAALLLANADTKRQLHAFERGIAAALRSGDARTALEFAADQPKNKEELKANLRYFAQRIALEARRSPSSYRARQGAAQYLVVQEALARLDRNVSQQLVLESLLLCLRQREV